MNAEEIAKRLDGVRYAMLDWAEDFRRIGDKEGEMSEKSRADLLGEAAALIRAQAKMLNYIKEELDDAQEDYLRTGGFPVTIIQRLAREIYNDKPIY